MFSAPGGSDSEVTGYVGNNRFESKGNYVVQFELQHEQVEKFVIFRPRDEWTTDLYGARNKELDQYSNLESLSLNNHHQSEYFNLFYSDLDSLNVEAIAGNLDANYSRIISKFRVNDMPKVRVSIYPTFESYHLAVLTPNAPKWQKGMAWSEDDIRMVSPEVVDENERAFVLSGAAVHEFAHSVHMQLASNVVSPRWLWEGVAMYVGCCQFYQPTELKYLKEGKQPSLNNNRNQQQAYQLGYYAVEYIKLEYGWEKVLDLVKSGGDTKASLNQNTSQFEKRFYRFLEEKYLN